MQCVPFFLVDCLVMRHRLREQSPSETTLFRSSLSSKPIWTLLCMYTNIYPKGGQYAIHLPSTAFLFLTSTEPNSSRLKRNNTLLTFPINPKTPSTTQLYNPYNLTPPKHLPHNMQTNRTPAPPNLRSSASTPTPDASVLPSPPSTPQTRTSSRSSRAYDQDEMVRQELASLPKKRTPKRRQHFGEKEEEDAAPPSPPPPSKRPKTQGAESLKKKQKKKSTASKPSDKAAPRSPPAQRKKRNAITTTREAAGRRAAGRRPPSSSLGQAQHAGPLLRGLQDALKGAGLDDRAIAERTEQGAEREYDRSLITELMGRRERFIAEWRGN